MYTSPMSQVRHISVRANAQDRELLQKAAEISGRPYTSRMLELALRDAKRVLDRKKSQGT